MNPIERLAESGRLRRDEQVIAANGPAIGLKAGAYLLADLTCIEPPDVWGRNVVSAFCKYKADVVIAETAAKW